MAKNIRKKKINYCPKCDFEMKVRGSELVCTNPDCGLVIPLKGSRYPAFFKGHIKTEVRKVPRGRR